MMRVVGTNMACVPPAANACFHPYPEQWRLPGDRTPSRQGLRAVEGAVRRNIVHALTYHELPPDIDRKISDLPSEENLAKLKGIQRDYISFTVYSLKQMIAAETISAETAWTLLFEELKVAGRLDRRTYDPARRKFLGRVRESICAEGIVEELDALQFEFFARAGEAGLASYERYRRWNPSFDLAIGEYMDQEIRLEYRKAVWLEMRLIEDRVGLHGINADVRTLKIGPGQYNRIYNTVRATIDLFDPHEALFCFDSSIKAEIGHWLFNRIDMAPWSSELMDRMNMAGFTRRIDRALALASEDRLPPEANVFLRGGFYLSGHYEGERYPCFPVDYQYSEKHAYDPHVHGEHVESLIRMKLVRALQGGLIPPGTLYQTYRDIGVYVALLVLEERTMDEIVERIGKLDMTEITGYRSSVGTRAVEHLLTELTWSDNTLRGLAAEALMNLLDLDENSDEYRALQAYALIGKQKWAEAAALGWLAIPALERGMEDRLKRTRMKSAEFVARMIDPEIAPDYYRDLYVRALVIRADWDALMRLGERALPALEKEFADGAGDWQAIQTIARINGRRATEIAEKLLDHEDKSVRAKAARVLIKITGCHVGSDEYERLHAYILMERCSGSGYRSKSELKRRQQIIGYGKHAVPAIVAAANGDMGAKAVGLLPLILGAEARQALETLRGHEDDTVRDAVAGALEGRFHLG